MHSRLRDRLRDIPKADLACYGALALMVVWFVGGIAWFALVGPK